MSLKSKTNNLLLSTLMLTGGIMTPPTEASITKVASTTQNEVFVRVVPGACDVNSTYCWSCFSSCLGALQCRVKNLNIPRECTGTDNFTIVGTEGGILFNGICGNLSTYKNYEVVFFDTSLGIGCRSKEI